MASLESNRTPDASGSFEASGWVSTEVSLLVFELLNRSSRKDMGLHDCGRSLETTVWTVNCFHFSVINGTDYGSAYRTGFPSTVRFLLSRGARSDGAEEMAQAAWTLGWERVHQLRNESLLRTWVNTIALNLYRRMIREERRREPLLERTGGSRTCLEKIDLSTLLSRCCPADRALLTAQMNGATTSEMASRVGTTRAAVRVRLTRARQAARRLLAC